MSDKTVIATRESRLALWQAEHVRDLLQTQFGREVELLGMTTKGDQILDRALSKVGGKGLFVKELETALEEGRAHLAVHSLKDVPMDLPAGFVLAAAGLKRLGLASRIRGVFEIDRMIPAAGQGALGIEVREDAHELRALLAQTVHKPTWLAAHAERAVSRALGGSCSMPLAAHATWEGGTLHLEAALGHATQLTLPLLRFTVEGAPADEASARRLGEEAAEGLRRAGASGYLGAA